MSSASMLSQAPDAPHLSQIEHGQASNNQVFFGRLGAILLRAGPGWKERRRNEPAKHGAAVTLARWIAVSLTVVAPLQTGWRMPATIEVTQDVEVRHLSRSDLLSGEPRGVLLLGGGQAELKAFQIKKGQTFQMLAIFTEGECRIKFGNDECVITSCPWLDGFRDHQADIFRVTSGREH
jgi:hypothetical protein